MPDHESVPLDNSRSGWDNVLLGQKVNKRGDCNKMTFFEKINFRGGVYSGLKSIHKMANLENCNRLLKMKGIVHRLFWKHILCPLR